MTPAYYYFDSAERRGMRGRDDEMTMRAQARASLARKPAPRRRVGKRIAY